LSGSSSADPAKDGEPGSARLTLPKSSECGASPTRTVTRREPANVLSDSSEWWCARMYSAVLTRALLQAVLALCVIPALACAQEAAAGPRDTRTQYPPFLIDSFVGITVGYIDYSFSQAQLEAGFRAATIAVPHLAARVSVFGHGLGRHFAVQGTYMRPVRFVTYTDINGDGGAHHVWTDFGGLTLRGRVPVAARASLYGEAGLGITSRHGFTRDGAPVVRDAYYASPLVGAGLDYHLRPTWDLTTGVTYSPSSAGDHEPRAVLASAGFRYTMRARPADRVEADAGAGFVFAHRILQIEYTTAYGYGINTFVSKTVPIFWAGNLNVDRGVAVHFSRNVYHTARLFALDFGASVSSWGSQTSRERFTTLSVYPLLRFTPIHTNPADVYFCYSLAGPTYISKVVIDDHDMGNHFTFQDFMGAGLLVGRDRHVSIGIKINHYSNGNLSTQNAGVTVPLTLTAGYAF
jgi:hypothetical protein